MESDGINEGLQREMQILLAAATQLGRKLAQLRETMQRRAARQSQQEADRLRSRLDSERAAARVVIDRTNDPKWWERARPDQIAETYRVARAWEDSDRDIRAARERMDRELTTRYGAGEAAHLRDSALTSESAVTPIEQARAWHAEHHPKEHAEWEIRYDNNDTGSGRRSDEATLVRRWERAMAEGRGTNVDPGQIREAEERMSRTPDTEAGESLDQLEAAVLLGEAAQLRDDAEAERAAAAEAERDEIAAEQPDQEHAAAADVDDHRANARASDDRAGSLEGEAAAVRYDSPERRDQTAATMQSRGVDGDLVVTRMSADVSQGRPAGAAVGQKSATRARKQSGVGAGADRSRQDRGR